MSDRHHDDENDVTAQDETCFEASDRRRIALLAAFAFDDEAEPPECDDAALPFLPHLAELAPVRRR